MTTGTTLAQSLGLFESHMRLRKFRASSLRTYRACLLKWIAFHGDDTPVVEVANAQSVEAFLERYTVLEGATYNLAHTILSSYFRQLVMIDVVDVSPMTKVPKAKVVPIAHRKRVRNTRAEHMRMLAEANGERGTWTERLTLNCLAYLGIRRTALANARWGDVNAKAEPWTLTVTEKGGKVRRLPVPHGLRKVFTKYAMECGPLAPDDWLVPNRRDTGRREWRDSRVIWLAVKAVAARCSPPIKTHVHSWRGGFALKCFDDGLDLPTVSALLGHSSVATTQASYLSEWNSERAMERVVGLSYESDRVEEGLTRGA